MEAVTRVRLSAQPNAGKPRDVEGRNIYLCSPEYMASYARRFILHNVRVVGGCCGTTPEHIRQIKLAVRGQAPAGDPAIRAKATVVRPAVAAPPVPRAQKSRLAGQMTRGAFVVGVELLPPRLRGRSGDPAGTRAQAVRRRRREHPRWPARRRAPQRAVAGRVDRAAGGHRNAASLFVPRSQPARHPVRPARRARWACATCCSSPAIPGASAIIPRHAVFDVDSIGLTNVVTRLNHGCDVGGQAIGAPTAFHLGVSFNPAAANLDEELRRFDYKVEAGAEFIVTRPIFDVAAFERLQADRSRTPPDRRRHLPVRQRSERRIHGQRSARRAVPDPIMERMRRADGSAAAAAEGIAVAREIAGSLRGPSRSRSRPPPAVSRRPWPSLMDFGKIQGIVDTADFRWCGSRRHRKLLACRHIC